MSGSQSDKDLLLSLKSDEQSAQAALSSLFRLYYPRLATYALSILHSRSSAEDVVQDVFTNIWNSRKRLNIQGDIKTYLYSSVHNRCMTALKNQKREVVSLDAAENVSAPTTNVLNAESTDDLLLKLDRAINNLPERTRMVFSLHREHNMTYSQIAQLLGVSPETVKSQIGRAIEELRKTVRN